MIFIIVLFHSFFIVTRRRPGGKKKGKSSQLDFPYTLLFQKMQQQNAQADGGAHWFFPVIKMADQQAPAPAVARATPPGIIVAPNAHDILFTPAQASTFATVVSQPTEAAAAAENKAPAGSHMQDRQKGNIDTKSDPSHILNPFLWFWSYGSGTWQAA
jgi:hypothetical protein